VGTNEWGGGKNAAKPVQLIFLEKVLPYFTLFFLKRSKFPEAEISEPQKLLGCPIKIIQPVNQRPQNLKRQGRV
jgi:hypothetical protein